MPALHTCGLPQRPAFLETVPVSMATLFRVLRASHAVQAATRPLVDSATAHSVMQAPSLLPLQPHPIPPVLRATLDFSLCHLDSSSVSRALLDTILLFWAVWPASHAGWDRTPLVGLPLAQVVVQDLCRRWWLPNPRLCAQRALSALGPLETLPCAISAERVLSGASQGLGHSL